MLRNVLLFLAGLLVGANLVYYFMSRGVGLPAPAAAPMATASTTPASAAAGSSSVAAQAPPTATASPARVAPTAAPPPSGAPLMPVAGVVPSQLSDTFHDTRGTDRIHEALDIMAPRGTPVVAAVDGKVAKLFTSAAGGLTVYQFDPTSTYAYYYAHLDSYAPGLHEGQLLRRGDPVGTVGSTGNANPDGPHLHFAIFLLGPEKKWHEGTPVNPYPLLVGRPR